MSSVTAPISPLSPRGTGIGGGETGAGARPAPSPDGAAPTPLSPVSSVRSGAGARPGPSPEGAAIAPLSPGSTSWGGASSASSLDRRRRPSPRAGGSGASVAGSVGSRSAVSYRARMAAQQLESSRADGDEASIAEAAYLVATSSSRSVGGRSVASSSVGSRGRALSPSSVVAKARARVAAVNRASAVLHGAGGADARATPGTVFSSDSSVQSVGSNRSMGSARSGRSASSRTSRRSATQPLSPEYIAEMQRRGKEKRLRAQAEREGKTGQAQKPAARRYDLLNRYSGQAAAAATSPRGATIAGGSSPTARRQQRLAQQQAERVPSTRSVGSEETALMRNATASYPVGDSRPSPEKRPVSPRANPSPEKRPVSPRPLSPRPLSPRAASGVRRSSVRVNRRVRAANALKVTEKAQMVPSEAFPDNTAETLNATPTRDVAAGSSKVTNLSVKIPESPTQLGTVAVTGGQQSPGPASLFRRTLSGSGKAVAQMPMVPSDSSRFRGVAYATPRVQAAADRIAAAKGRVSARTGSTSSPERPKNKWTDGAVGSAKMDTRNVSPPRASSPMKTEKNREGTSDAPKTPRASSPGSHSTRSKSDGPRSPQQLFFFRAFESRTVPPAPDLPMLAGTASPPKGGSREEGEDEGSTPEIEDKEDIGPKLMNRLLDTAEQDGAPAAEASIATDAVAGTSEGQEGEIKEVLKPREDEGTSLPAMDKEITSQEEKPATASVSSLSKSNDRGEEEEKLVKESITSTIALPLQKPTLPKRGALLATKLSARDVPDEDVVLPPTLMMSMDEGTEVMGLGALAPNLSPSRESEADMSTTAVAPPSVSEDALRTPLEKEAYMTEEEYQARRQAAAAAVLNDPEMFLPPLSPTNVVDDKDDEVLGMRSPKSDAEIEEGDQDIGHDGKLSVPDLSTAPKESCVHDVGAAGKLDSVEDTKMTHPGNDDTILPTEDGSAEAIITKTEIEVSVASFKMTPEEDQVESLKKETAAEQDSVVIQAYIEAARKQFETVPPVTSLKAEAVAVAKSFLNSTRKKSTEEDKSNDQTRETFKAGVDLATCPSGATDRGASGMLSEEVRKEIAMGGRTSVQEEAKAEQMMNGVVEPTNAAETPEAEGLSAKSYDEAGSSSSSSYGVSVNEETAADIRNFIDFVAKKNGSPSVSSKLALSPSAGDGTEEPVKIGSFINFVAENPTTTSDMASKQPDLPTSSIATSPEEVSASVVINMKDTKDPAARNGPSMESEVRASFDDASSDNDSDVDPYVRDNIAEFIDRLAHRKAGKNPESKEALGAEGTSSESEVEALKPLGETVGMPCAGIQPDKIPEEDTLGDEYEDGDVTPEIRAGISAFIDSVQNNTSKSGKAETTDGTVPDDPYRTGDMYLSSDSDANEDEEQSHDSFNLETEADIDAFITVMDKTTHNALPSDVFVTAQNHEGGYTPKILGREEMLTQTDAQANKPMGDPPESMSNQVNSGQKPDHEQYTEGGQTMETIDGSFFLAPPNDAGREGGRNLYSATSNPESFTYTFDDADGTQYAQAPAGNLEMPNTQGHGGDDTRKPDDRPQMEADQSITYIPSSPVPSNLVGVNLLQANSTSFSYAKREDSFDHGSEGQGTTEEPLPADHVVSSDVVSSNAKHTEIPEVQTTAGVGGAIESAKDDTEPEHEGDVIDEEDMDTAPEGASAEELKQLNYYVRKAVELVDSNDLSIDKMQDVLLAARVEGIPYEIIMQIFEASLYGGKPKDYKLSPEEDIPQVATGSEVGAPADIESARLYDLKCDTQAGNEKKDEAGSDAELDDAAQREVENIWKMGNLSEDSDDSSFLHPMKSFGSIESVNEDDAISDFLVRLKEKEQQGEKLPEKPETQAEGGKADILSVEYVTSDESESVDDEADLIDSVAELVDDEAQLVDDEADELAVKADLTKSGAGQSADLPGNDSKLPHMSEASLSDRSHGENVGPLQSFGSTEEKDENAGGVQVQVEEESTDPNCEIRTDNDLISEASQGNDEACRGEVPLEVRNSNEKEEADNSVPGNDIQKDNDLISEASQANDPAGEASQGAVPLEVVGNGTEKEKADDLVPDDNDRSVEKPQMESPEEAQLQTAVAYTDEKNMCEEEKKEASIADGNESDVFADEEEPKPVIVDAHVVEDGGTTSEEGKKEATDVSHGPDPVERCEQSEGEMAIMGAEDHQEAASQEDIGDGCSDGGDGFSANSKSVGDDVDLPQSLANQAIDEYLKRFVQEDLPRSEEEKLRVYMGIAAAKVESKVPIKEAAREVLRSSRKDGVQDAMIVKIFQCLKIAEDSRESQEGDEKNEVSVNLQTKPGQKPEQGPEQEQKEEEETEPEQEQKEEGETEPEQEQKEEEEPEPEPVSSSEPMVDKSVGDESPAVSKTASEDSSDSASAASVDYEAKFGKMEELDEDDDIQAFLTRFKLLKEGGHFPDANVDALKNISNVGSNGDDDAVEVDLVHGFVNKDLTATHQELTDEEKLWSEGPEKDLYRKYSDFLKKMPVEIKKPKDGIEEDDEIVDKYLTTQEIAEVRDVDSGDAEVYLMDEAVVEVAYVDEEEANREEEAEEKRDSAERTANSRGSGKSSEAKGKVAVFKKPGEKLAALEKMFEDRDEKIIRENRQKKAQLDHWESPWEKRYSTDQAEGISPKKEGTPGIDGVAAAAAMKSIPKRRGRQLNLPITQQWRLSYKERTKAHTGYFEVDFYSLYESAVVKGEAHRMDNTPWEQRDVKQRFLYEKDIGFTRNWFGAFIKARGNDKYFEPVCHPRSMRMLMDNIPEPGEWSEDWYTTWQSRKDNPNNLKMFEMEENMEGSDEDSDNSDKKETSNADSVKDEDESYWEDDPEVGSLCTVRLKIGERVSRVHPNHTSTLRKSKWRRKYFPKDMFPFD